MKRAMQLQELATLRADIDKEQADGRLQDCATARIIEQGRKLLAARSRCA
jgi:hypothetical protein